MKLKIEIEILHESTRLKVPAGAGSGTAGISSGRSSSTRREGHPSSPRLWRNLRRNRGLLLLLHPSQLWGTRANRQPARSSRKRALHGLWVRRCVGSYNRTRPLHTKLVGDPQPVDLHYLCIHKEIQLSSH